eukprot:jgi/Bigna1/138567/aug1.45_g13275
MSEEDKSYSYPTPFPVLCVVGAGNASHVFIPLFASQGYTVDVYAGYGDEAERLLKATETQPTGIHVCDRRNPGKKREFSGKPRMISKNPQDVIPKADAIIMALPSFAFRSVFEEIKPHLKPHTIIGKLTVAGIIPMPLNCRILEFGKKVDFASLKDSYELAAIPSDQAAPAAKLLSRILRRNVQPLSHFAAIALHASNPNIHPARLYGLFSDHREGKVYKENPLFYETFDEKSAEWAQKVSDERIKVWREIVRKMKIGEVNEVPQLKEYVMAIYGDQIHDKSSLASVFSTNDGFKGFRCPMKRVGDGWTLNFHNRYFIEDIPEGFCVYKGIADLAGVKTPAIDKILGFFQKFMNFEFIKDGKLQGRDVGRTKAPQAFGITTLDEYINGTSRISQSKL